MIKNYWMQCSTATFPYNTDLNKQSKNEISNLWDDATVQKCILVQYIDVKYLKRNIKPCKLLVYNYTEY